jgi:hypothetical protein
LTRNGIYRILVSGHPSSAVLQIPNRRVSILRLVRRIVRFVEDESANGVESRRSEVSQGTVDTEPGGESDEVVVLRWEVVSTSDISRDKLIL